MLALTSLLLLAPQTTWFVDGAGTAPGSGTALDPYTSVSDALGRATTVPGDTVLVAPGTYANESLDYAGKDVAVISSDGAASTVLTAPPISFGAGVMRFPVARFTGGEGSGARLEGFTLRDGSGSFVPGGGSFPDTIGGCILVDGSSPTIASCLIDAANDVDLGAGAGITNGAPTFTDCTFTGLTANRSGAAIYVNGGAVTIEGCTVASCGDLFGDPAGGVAGRNALVRILDSTIHSCRSSFDGAGINLRDCSTLIERSTIRDCEGFGRGVGLAQDGGLLLIRNTVFDDNRSYDYAGGGLFVRRAGVADIQGTTFRSNSATTQGRAGAILLDDASLTVIDCRFDSNRASFGAGVQVESGDAVFADCVFDGNRAGDCGFDGSCAGAAIHSWASGMVEAVNCTFQSNLVEASFSGDGTGGATINVDHRHSTFVGNTTPPGGFLVVGGSVDGSILWGNTGPGLSPSTPATWSLVEGGAPGTGNLDEDPRFWSTSDPQLLPQSPAINAASPLDPLDGNGTRADMGALPFEPSHCGEFCAAGPLGGTTCASLPNSSGARAHLDGAGSRVIQDDRVVLVAQGVPANAVGAFLASLDQDFVPFFGGGSGVLCLGGSILRFTNTPVVAAPDGTTAFRPILADFPQGTTVLSGDTWTFQLWFRDGSGGIPTTNTSDAYAVTFE